MRLKRFAKVRWCETFNILKAPKMLKLIVKLCVFNQFSDILLHFVTSVNNKAEIDNYRQKLKIVPLGSIKQCISC